MKKFKDVEKILTKNKNLIKRRYNVKTLGVFGSYVRGDQKAKSDIDILVEFRKPIDFFVFLDLEEALSKLLSSKVDLVMKKALRPAISEIVQKEIVYV